MLELVLHYTQFNYSKVLIFSESFLFGIIIVQCEAKPWNLNSFNSASSTLSILYIHLEFSLICIAYNFICRMCSFASEIIGLSGWWMVVWGVNENEGGQHKTNGKMKHYAWNGEVCVSIYAKQIDLLQLDNHLIILQYI